MQVVTNNAYVQSRTNLGNYMNFASMALLIVGMVLSFMLDRLGSLSLWLSYGALIIALMLLNFARPLTRRFGGKWRQDQWLIPNMKGLDTKATLFNFASPKLPDHVLVAPSGLYVIVPKPNGGTIRFDGQRWSRGSVAGSMLRSLGEGGLGDPIQDVKRSIALTADYLRTYGSEDLIRGLEAKPLIVFTNPGAQLEVRNSPFPIVTTRELRGLFRRARPSLSDERLEELKQVLGREAGE